MVPLRFFASVVLLSCFYGHIACAELYLNATTASSCTLVNGTLCWFQDAALWDGGAAPTTGDTVTLLATWAPIYLFYNASIALTNLTVQGAITFVLRLNASVTADNVALSGAAVIVALEDASAIVCRQETRVTEGAKLDVNDNAGYTHQGSLFVLSGESSVFVAEMSYLGLLGTSSYIYGQFVLTAGSIFVSTGNIYFENQKDTIVFVTAPTIYSAYFYSSVVVFEKGWLMGSFAYLRSSSVTIFGPNPLVLSNATVDPQSTLSLRGIADCALISPNITGTLNVSTSNVRLYQKQSFNSPLVLGGDSDFTVDVLILKTVSFGPGEAGEKPNVNVMTSILHVFGDFYFPGEISVYQYAYFGGSITLAGGVSISGDMYVEAPLFIAGGAINIGYGPMRLSPRNLTLAYSSSLSLTDTYFQAPTIYIGNNVTFDCVSSIVSANVEIYYNSSLVHHNTTFNGSIYNEGFIDVHADRILTVLGNYTQGKQGTLTIANLDLSNRTGGYINANGSVNLDGTILYSIRTAALDDRRMQLLAVAAYRGVFGSFQSQPTNIGLLRNTALLTYTINDVYLVFGKDIDGGEKLSWWVWFIVVFGLASAAGLATLLYTTRHRRKGYVPVGLSGLNN